ncbi:autotransporter outer membrane beta-barrel domain-containing protein [Brevundimonas sp. S30B]|uniref:autotransporter outer membrane beta-barrel domain-containing protein n=1 Tax=unclassified Brevundimonas TaxID=2622653 RepID=UPI001072913F|nr:MULTISPECIES: autotransporter domain-containing protein [unclassified Brevundimonas]QBX37982.1 autotransporter outer membrane beta-barrel domain-containing protein [Brevundimonas sp. MF30-B]TFW02663.1 autotransporter outer membrane beta-barrel domain-containing protein [Brevundimonas sp. S30B]
MRILLATAVAIAPLMIAAGAQAEVVISSARTTPIITSNATGSGPDNIRLANGGSISVTSGAAITVDSNHTVGMDTGSSITMENAQSDVAAIHIQGGVTTGLRISGVIQVTDDITVYPDTDGDGDLDGPWATGSGRYGVRVSGPGAVTGDILVEGGGAIGVEGNSSYGISVESALNGRLQIVGGTIQVVGDDTVAVRTTATVDGPVNIGGRLNATGENAVGVLIGGDVTDRVAIQANITTTGYRYPTRATPEFISKLDPDDLLQGGPAVVVAGNVGRGVIIDAPPQRDPESQNTDQDGDGIPDASETTALITTSGSAPAVLIGATDRAITLGVAGDEDNAFGFINRGEINAFGVYDEVSATGVRFGADGGGAVTVQGGIRNEGTVNTVSFEADSVTYRVGSGVATPQLVNTGVMNAVGTTDGADTVANILLEAGASVTTLENRGFLQATGSGNAANVFGVLDLSGTLTSITNYRSIQASLLTSDGPVTGSTNAIDVSANITGVTIVQDGIIAEDGNTDADADGDGVPDAREPSIVGSILLGSGADVVDIRNGTVAGDIFFGAGADQLLISGGAVVRGEIDSGDGQLDINIADGRLDSRNTSAQNISSLSLGDKGALIVTLDPASGNTNAGFDVTGQAVLAEGSSVGVRFNSLIDDPTRFSIVRANSLSVSGLDRDEIQANSPYLFVVEADANIPAGELFVDVRRRTADEASLIRVEGQAFDAVYEALKQNDPLRGAFINQLDREGFIDLYEQMLPDHSGGPLLSLASGVDAVTRALTGRNATAAPGQTSAWVQEINFYADKDKTDSYGFRSEGFGFAGGVERGTGLGAFGISTAFTSSDLKDPEAEAEEVLSASLFELGAYWRAQGQYWSTWARAAAGYATFDSTRQLIGEGLNLRTESDWHGFTLAAAGGASYERHFGRVNVRPEVYLEYFSLSEDAHTESGGGDGFDLDFDKRNGHLFSAVAAMNVGYGFGRDGNIRPELRLGWRQNISVEAGDTIARFASGGPDFRLTPGSIKGGGPIIGFRLNVGNELGMLSITGDAELLEDYVRYSLLLRASFRF